MESKELREYIQTQINNGVSKEEITKTLQEQGGWAEKDITDAFSVVEKSGQIQNSEVEKVEEKIEQPEIQLETFKKKSSNHGLQIVVVIVVFTIISVGGYFGVKHFSASTDLDETIIKDNEEKEDVRGETASSTEQEISSEELPSEYAVKEDGVYYKGELLEEIDLETFEYLGDYYSKDENSVYMHGEIIEGVDPKTVRVEGKIIVDKNQLLSVYNYKPQTLVFENSDDGVKVDLESFRFVDNDYYKDSYFVYSYGLFQRTEPLFLKRVLNIDSETFEVIGVCSWNGQWISSYIKDKNSVYCADEKIEGADPKTFEIVGEKGAFEGGVSIALDKNNLYFWSRKIKNIDKNSLEIIKDPEDNEVVFLKDKNNVYFTKFPSEEGELIVFEQADVLTFEYLGSYYSKDKNNVYKGNEIVEGADPANCTVDNLEGCGVSVDSLTYVDPIHGYSFSYTEDMQLVAAGHIPSELTYSGVTSMKDLNLSDGDSLLTINLESGDNVIYTILELSSRNGYTTFDEYIDMFFENLDESGFAYTASESIVGEDIVSTEVFFKTEVDARTGVFYDNVFEAGEKVFSISFGHPEDAENAEELLANYRDLLSSFKVEGDKL